MKHTDIKQILIKPEEYFGKSVTVCGWIRSFRDSKNMAFIALNDGTTLSHLQIVIDKSSVSLPDGATRVGSSVKIEGTAVKSLNKNQAVEVNAAAITLLGDCPLDYPIQKAKTSLDYLRTLPHLRVRTNTFNAVFRIRSKISAAIHRYFQERDYIYAHTPIITGSDCEGAGKIFQVTTLGFAPEYKTAEEYNAADFFGQSAGLTVSGQLEGEVMATAFGKIYTFGPTFRAENSNTTRHAAEFWMIEPEMAFCDLAGDMDVAEAMVKSVAEYVHETCAFEVDFLAERVCPELKDRFEALKGGEFVRLSYTKAIEILKKAISECHKFEYPVEWGCDLQSEHERYLTETVYKKPVFLTDYPKGIKAFYMRLNDDKKTVAAADLLVPGIGELIGGSQREERLDVLEERMKECGLNAADYEFYTDLRRYGGCVHSGFGLGFERLIMYLTGVSNIRDVIPFPRTVGNLEY